MLLPSVMNGVTVYDAQPGLAVPPIPINFYSALSSPAYFAAMRFLSENLQRLPRQVKLNGAAPEKPHPLDYLLEKRPNRYQNSTMLWRTLYFHAAHYNNGYLRIERDPVTFAPIGFHTLLSENILPFRYDDGKGGGPVQYFAEFTTRKIYNGDDVIHLAGMSYDGIRGIDGIALHGGTLQQASTLDRFQTKFLQKGTNILGVISFQGDVSKEKFEEVRQMLREKYSGIESEENLLLGNGAEYKNNTINPQQSQLNEQQMMSTKKIAQITGVDPAFLFDKSESKYTGIAEAGENVVRWTLSPWIEQIEDELSIKLLSEAEIKQGFWINIDTSALIKGDLKQQTDIALQKKAAGVFTANQALVELGYPKSTDSEADKLKTSGDTSPQKPPAAA